MESGPSPYAAPREVRDARPAVIVWFRVYSAAMAVGALAVLAIAIMTVVSPSSGAAADPSARSISIMMIGTAIPFVALFAVATFAPFKPWGWSIAMFAIAMGLVSGGFLFAVPLLYFWFKPNVKAAFARL